MFFRSSFLNAMKLAVGVPVVCCAIEIANCHQASAQEQKQTAAEIVPNVAYGGTVLALSPDGRILASTGVGNSINLWDFDSGRLLRTLERHAETITSLQFVSGGQALVSAGRDVTVKVWDVATGASLRTLELAAQVGPTTSVRLSPDGKRVVVALSGLPGIVKIWDVETGKLLTNFSSEPRTTINQLAFSDDGKQLASSGDHYNDCATQPCLEVRLWDATEGKLLRTFRPNRPSNFGASIAISPDGKRIVSAGAKIGLQIWDVSTGKMLNSVEGDAGTVVFAPDGGTFMTSEFGKSIQTLWRTDSGTPIKSYEKGFGAVLFLPGKNQFVRSSLGLGLQILDLATGEVQKTFGSGGSKVPLSFSSENGYLLSAGRTFGKWDARSGELLREENPFSQQGARAAAAYTADGNRVLWALDDQKTLKVTDGKRGEVLSTIVESARIAKPSFSGDGGRIVAVVGDVAKIWDARTGNMIRTIQAREDQRTWDGWRLSGDGARIAAGDFNGNVRLWDVETGQVLWTFTLPDNGIRNFSFFRDYKFSSDGKLLLAASGDTPKLLEASTGRLLQTLSGHPRDSTAPWGALSPDSSRALTCGFDGICLVWEVATGRKLLSFNTPGSADLSISRDNKRALVNGVMWNLDTGERIFSSFRAGTVGATDWLVVTPEGFFAGTPKGAEMLSVVKGLEVWAIDQFYNQLYRPDLVRAKLAGDPQGKVREAAAKLDLAKAVASGGAPRVGIAAPSSGGQVQGDQAAVEAEITDQGGGIGKVEWRVNGVTLGVEERGVRRTEQGTAKSIKVSRTLGLTPGENRIAVLAYNAAGLIASAPAEITVTSVQQAATKPRLYVLAVGVNDYWDGALRLSYAAPDARRVGDGLKRAGGKLYEQVEISTVLDGEATAEKLDGVFAELGRKIRPQDVFVFFLAGHGKTVDARFYFLPQDFRYAGEDSITQKGIGQDRLQGWFSRIKAQKSVLLFDACESGSLVGDRIAMRGIEEKTAIDRMTRAMGRTVLTATTDSKPAIEGYRGHGVFTYTLLAGLDAADANNDGVIDVTELAQYVDRRLPDLTYDAFKLRQVPQMSIVGSNFPLASKVALLPADGGSAAAAIPTKPTHVVITPAQVRQSAAQSGAAVAELPAGAQVTLVSREGSWIVIARDGKKIGYVEEKALLALQ